MNLEEVLERLGLMPFAEYERCPKRLAWIAGMKKHNPDENISFRARGTTTKMLCEALVFLSYLPEGKKVYTKGHDPQYSRQLCYTAREYAYKLGLNPRDVQPFYRDTHFASQRGLYVFVDHYCRLGI